MFARALQVPARAVAAPKRPPRIPLQRRRSMARNRGQAPCPKNGRKLRDWKLFVFAMKLEACAAVLWQIRASAGAHSTRSKPARHVQHPGAAITRHPTIVVPHVPRLTWIYPSAAENWPLAAVSELDQGRLSRQVSNATVPRNCHRGFRAPACPETILAHVAGTNATCSKDVAIAHDLLRLKHAHAFEMDLSADAHREVHASVRVRLPESLWLRMQARRRRWLAGDSPEPSSERRRVPKEE